MRVKYKIKTFHSFHGSQCLHLKHILPKYLINDILVLIREQLAKMGDTGIVKSLMLFLCNNV